MDRSNRPRPRRPRRFAAWEEWFRRAPAGPRTEILALADRQGFLSLHQLPPVRDATPRGRLPQRRRLPWASSSRARPTSLPFVSVERTADPEEGRPRPPSCGRRPLPSGGTSGPAIQSGRRDAHRPGLARCAESEGRRVLYVGPNIASARTRAAGAFRVAVIPGRALRRCRGEGRQRSAHSLRSGGAAAEPSQPTPRRSRARPGRGSRPRPATSSRESEGANVWSDARPSSSGRRAMIARQHHESCSRPARPQRRGSSPRGPIAPLHRPDVSVGPVRRRLRPSPVDASATEVRDAGEARSSCRTGRRRRLRSSSTMSASRRLAARTAGRSASRAPADGGRSNWWRAALLRASPELQEHGQLDGEETLGSDRARTCIQGRDRRGPCKQLAADQQPSRRRGDRTASSPMPRSTAVGIRAGVNRPRRGRSRIASRSMRPGMPGPPRCRIPPTGRPSRTPRRSPSRRSAGRPGT